MGNAGVQNAEWGIRNLDIHRCILPHSPFRIPLPPFLSATIAHFSTYNRFHMNDALCLICNGTQLNEKFAQGQWRYVVCAACGHARLSPLPEPEVLQLFYEEAYFIDSETGGYANYLQDETLHRMNAKARLACLARAGGQGGKLLDVGCATGFFLDEDRKSVV